MSGFAEYTKPLDGNAIETKMLMRIEEYTRKLHIFEQLKKALTKFEGKKVTKRMSTNCEKELGTRCYIKHSRNSIKMCVQIRDLVYETFLLCHNSDPVYREKDFNKHHISISSIPDDIRKIQEGIPLIQDFARQYNELLEKSKELVKKTKKYNMEFEFDLILIGSR